MSTDEQHTAPQSTPSTAKLKNAEFIHEVAQISLRIIDNQESELHNIFMFRNPSCSILEDAEVAYAF